MTDQRSPRLPQSTGALTTAATRLMEEGLPWYRDLGAKERSWVGLVAQAGITAFVDWYNAPSSRRTLTTDVFGAAPRELARILSLEQTVDGPLDDGEPLVITTADHGAQGLLGDQLGQDQVVSRVLGFLVAY